MIENKRFTIDNESDIIEFDWHNNEYIDDFMWSDGKSWDRVCNRLNELYEENEQLKKQLECSREEADDYCEELMGRDEFVRLYKRQRDDALKENEELKADNNRLVNETAKIIAEHQKNVLNLIDEKITEYIYKEKLYKHKSKDREASVFNLYCFCLNNLKKELCE